MDDPVPESLAWGPGPERVAPGTIIAQSVAGRVTFAPKQDRTVLFGRGDLDVHVCVGGTDLAVSREQGTLTYRDGLWWIANLGIRPVRLPSRLLFKDEEPVPLDEGYTALFIMGTGRREHLLEIYIVGSAGRSPAPRYKERTLSAKTWYLSQDERLALIAVGHRYLRHDPQAQPATWQAAADLLNEAKTERHWTRKIVMHHVEKVRERLVKDGVKGLTEKEVGRPVGNALNHNLIRALMLSTTLVPMDVVQFDAMFD